MNHAAIALMALAGFALLMLAMPRHHQDWLRRRLSARSGRLLRAGGFALLIAAFVLAGLCFGWAYGAVEWFGWLTAAAAIALVTNSNTERLLRRS